MSAPYDIRYDRVPSALPLDPCDKLQSEVMSLALDYSRFLAGSPQPGDAVAQVLCAVAPVTVPPLAVDLGTIQPSYDGIPQTLEVFSVTGGVAGVGYALTMSMASVQGIKKTDVIYTAVSDAAPAGYPGGYPISSAVDVGGVPTVWLGSGLPWSGLGADGDYFLNKLTKAMHGPREGGVWPSTPTYKLPAWYKPNTVV